MEKKILEAYSSITSLTDDRFILINYHSYTASDLKLLETMQTFGENTWQILSLPL